MNFSLYLLYILFVNIFILAGIVEDADGENEKAAKENEITRKFICKICEKSFITKISFEVLLLSFNNINNVCVFVIVLISEYSAYSYTLTLYNVNFFVHPICQ